MPIEYVDSIEKLLIFILTLSILVVVHEGGHFWVARWNGVAVTEFAVGFGPCIASIRSKRSGTRYRLNAIPLGGYCAMLGEDARRETPGDPIEVVGVDFAVRSTWQRFAIIVAGPVVNVVSAFLILLFSALIVGVPGEKSTTTVGQLMPGKPAQLAGLKTGDRIVSIDGLAIRDGQQMVQVINDSLGKTLKIAYTRAGVQREAQVKPIAMDRRGKKIGVTGFMPLTEYRHLGVPQAIAESWKQLGDMWQATATGLSDLVLHASKAGDELVGPVGMARAAVAIQDYGLGAYLWFAAFISLSLGIFNLLPIPALDGGRIVFIVLEMLRGRPIDAEKEALVHLTGFAALIAFVLFRTYHDILNMVAGKSAI